MRGGTPEKGERTFIEFTGLSHMKVIALLTEVFGRERTEEFWSKKVELYRSVYRLRLKAGLDIAYLQEYADNFAKIADEKLGKDAGTMPADQYATLVGDLKTLGR